MKDNFERRRNIHEGIVYLVCAVIVTLLMVGIYQYILISSRVASESMEPTLMTGDCYVGNRLAYIGEKTPERFDIVLFTCPDDPDNLYVKRIIGLPGEKLTIKDGAVYINDSLTPLEETFISEPMEPNESMEFNIPEHHYFMMGDNRNNSFDSRYWENSYVEEDDIVAKAMFRLWKGFKIIS